MNPKIKQKPLNSYNYRELKEYFFGTAWRKITVEAKAMIADIAQHDQDNSRRQAAQKLLDYLKKPYYDQLLVEANEIYGPVLGEERFEEEDLPDDRYEQYKEINKRVERRLKRVIMDSMDATSVNQKLANQVLARIYNKNYISVIKQGQNEIQPKIMIQRKLEQLIHKKGELCEYKQLKEQQSKQLTNETGLIRNNIKEMADILEDAEIPHNKME